MTRQFLDYDPQTGISDWMELDESAGQLHVHRSEDVEPLLDRNRELRNTGYADRGIKQCWWHVATIPTTVVLELKKKGLDIFDKNHEAAVTRELQRNYRYLCTTDKRF